MESLGSINTAAVLHRRPWNENF